MTDANAAGSAEPLRAVLDTSALLSTDRHWLWLLAREHVYEAVWSTFIVGELVRIRVEQAIAHQVERATYRERINNLVHRLSDVAAVADYRTILIDGMLSDPDDEPILATALAARAGYIVSHNVRDFPAGNEALGVRFITPLAFLDLLAGADHEAGLVQRAASPSERLP